MKKMIFTFLLGTLLTQASYAQFGADQTKVDISCQSSNSQVRDGGFNLVIESGGLTGMTFATLSENTIMGAQVVGVFPVKRANRGMQTFYKGKNFKLSINLESIVATDEHPAVLKAITDDGNEVLENLSCTFE